MHYQSPLKIELWYESLDQTTNGSEQKLSDWNDITQENKGNSVRKHQ